jgi:poly [ADP-ribose] polymerase
LSDIAEEVGPGESGSIETLTKLSDEYYNIIPHISKGYRIPVEPITTPQQVEKEIKLLETLDNIESAVSAFMDGAQNDVHLLDTFYSNMKNEIKPLERDSPQYKMLSKYLINGRGRSHNKFTMEIEDIFQLDKRELDNEEFRDLGNKMLLWHGSLRSNWGGIFKQGLKIAPPEAPSTGAMFGKGIYFADMSYKSAFYCSHDGSYYDGILLLSEVSLGESKELIREDKHAKEKLARDDLNSVKGLGQKEPNPEMTTILEDMQVPMGTPVPTHVESDLTYNEFVVYDEFQTKMRYAVKVKFSMENNEE